MSAFDVFAKMIGVRSDQADDALRSERAARATLSRRSFGAVAASLVAGTAFSFAPHEEMFRLPSSVGLADGSLVFSWEQGLYVFMKFLKGVGVDVDGLNVVRPASGSGLWVRVVDGNGQGVDSRIPPSKLSRLLPPVSGCCRSSAGRAETS